MPIENLDAQVAQAQSAPVAQAQPTRDPLAAYTPLSGECEVEGGFGTVLVAERKSTGVRCLVYVPASRKRAQAIPLNAVTDAGFLTEAQWIASTEPDDAPEDAPETDEED